MSRGTPSHPLSGQNTHRLNPKIILKKRPCVVVVFITLRGLFFACYDGLFGTASLATKRKETRKSCFQADFQKSIKNKAVVAFVYQRGNKKGRE